MTDRPTPDQLDHLLGTADRRRLTLAEAALLRAGVQDLRKAAASACTRSPADDTAKVTK
ncbi:hypothetical protein [Kitasatospora sp. NBC_01300]|uniref:hypothetical protein n=1 Tax=Kitasatospora sp. NBC_01300 TaxID=2903574 RepID=UPI00352BF981|nr:hypothetical protein OG556_16260 [Kitasatospora sp. NBC_01300]